MRAARQAPRVHQRGARDFFDALVALELLDRDARGHYANRRDCVAYLDRRSPSYLGGKLEHLNARLSTLGLGRSQIKAELGEFVQSN
jgi:hypothetical protein